MLENPSFRPCAAQRLFLGRRHHIADWIKPALIDLIRSPFKTFPDTLVVDIGPSTLLGIARAREELERYRKTLS